jgi:hypothetical protein
MEWVDVGILILALSAAAYYSLKRVSRKAIFILSVAAVLYFGFYREGCVCPIGSIQNVAQGIGASAYGYGQPYVLPLTVVLFFLLPLIFALFFGASSARRSARWVRRRRWSSSSRSRSRRA